MGIGTGRCCVSCKIAYIPLKNDIAVIEMSDKECKTPYKLWAADLLECPKCNHLLISGFGARPIAEHYQDDFQEQVDHYFQAGILFTISGYRYKLNKWNGETNAT